MSTDTPTPVGYRRDTSWHRNPNWSAPKRVHKDRGNGFAACSTMIMLVTEKPVHISDLPHDDSLCRRCFPSAGTGLTVDEVVTPPLAVTPTPDTCPHWGHANPGSCGICAGVSS